jgi:5-methylcytosine-specific restriction endonuclease McrA
MQGKARTYHITTNRKRRDRGTPKPATTKAEMKKRRWLTRQLIQKYGGLCCVCEEPVNLVHDDPRQASIDHIIPVSKGGTEALANLRLACASCNSHRGNDDISEEEDPVR